MEQKQVWKFTTNTPPGYAVRDNVVSNRDFFLHLAHPDPQRIKFSL
jgi:hypothetical protein